MKEREAGHHRSRQGVIRIVQALERLVKLYEAQGQRERSRRVARKARSRAGDGAEAEQEERSR